MAVSGLPLEPDEAAIFPIVNQLNLGSSLIEEHDERARLARRGVAEWSQQDLEQATEAFAGAAELDPDRPERLYDLGTALAAGGQLETAASLHP